MTEQLVINLVGEMLVIHLDEPDDTVVKDRVQEILMIDPEPESIIVFDDRGYRILEPRSEHEPMETAWTAAMSF